MSYTELDAWMDEKSRDDWPPSRWQLCPLNLRDELQYSGLEWALPPATKPLYYRIKWHMRNATRERLDELLEAAQQTVLSAMEHADDEAQSAYHDGEAWLPVVDLGLDGYAEPAVTLVQCVDAVGPPDDIDEAELHGALALWCLGEVAAAHKAKDTVRELWAVNQAAFAVAETEFHRGITEKEREERKAASARSRRANDKRHAFNRERSKKASAFYRATWQGRTDAESRAEAADAISREFSVARPVAVRWVKAFEAEGPKAKCRP